MDGFFCMCVVRARPCIPVLLAALCFLYTLVYLNWSGTGQIKPAPAPKARLHTSSDWRLLSAPEVANMSVLGRILFLGQQTPMSQPNRTYTIAIWRHGNQLENRFLKRYGKTKIDPFLNCDVSNCRIVYRDADVTDADAVLFHLHKTPGPDSLPKTRSPDQRWIFFTDENPRNTFLVTKKYSMWDYDGVFNWSMHYRMDADVPVPYGRTIPLSENERASVNHASNKTKLVAIMGSNCGLGQNKRWSYVRELKKHVPVDMYGRCGDLKCAGHYDLDCTKLDAYKFYLAFESGDCEQYVTEKAWWHGYQRGAIPVVMGPRRSDYEKMLPPDSFIHVDDFDTPEDLARHILFLNSSDTDYNRYFEWTSSYRVINEHGYFQSNVVHYCRICEALNYNDETPKVYTGMESYWNPKLQCYPPGWVNRMQNLSVTDHHAKKVIFVMGIEGFRITFDRRGPYRPGDSLTGKVTFRVVGKPVSHKGVTLKVLGGSHVSWKVGNTKFIGGDPYIRAIITLVPDDTMLTLGDHKYLFAFLLPMGLPSSFEGSNGRVSYAASASVVMKWRWNYSTGQKGFVVTGIRDLNSEPLRRGGIYVQETKEMTCFWFKRGPVTAMGRLSRSGYVPGEIVMLDAEVENGSDRRVKVQAVLKQVVVYKITYERLFGGNKQAATSEEVTLASTEVRVVPEKESMIWSGKRLRLDQSLVPTDLGGHCRCISVSYQIRIKVKPGGILLVLPIVIGTVPLRQNVPSTSSDSTVPPSPECRVS